VRSLFTAGLPEVLGIMTAEATDNPEPQALVPWWSFSKTVIAAAALVWSIVASLNSTG
jgi:hypothetical protein